MTSMTTATPPEAPTRGTLHAVDLRPRSQPPAKRDLYRVYLDFMRRSTGNDAAPHRDAHEEFCNRLRIPAHIGDPLWERWLRHYLRFGPDWA